MFTARRTCLAVAPFFLIACGEDDDLPQGVEPTPYVLSARAMVGTETLDCQGSYAGVGSNQATVALRDFKVYLSNIRLVDAAGVEYPFGLDDDGEWQNSRVGLFDFEDGTGTCVNGDADTNDVLTGSALTDEVAGLRFDIGVPFDLNHLDVATAAAPLDRAGMYWVWANGYKFLRLDFSSDQPTANTSYNVHLGSRGCASVGPIAPTEACAQPNVASVELMGFDPREDVLTFDLAGLLAKVDTSTQTAGTAAGCQSGTAEAMECTPVFEGLGLSFADGVCANDCAGQTFVGFQ